MIDASEEEEERRPPAAQSIISIILECREDRRRCIIPDIPWTVEPLHKERSQLVITLMGIGDEDGLLGRDCRKRKVPTLQHETLQQ